MNFYSCYANGKHKAISLHDIRSIFTYEGMGGSQVRYGVRVEYFNDTAEALSGFTAEQAEKIYKEILEILNKPLDNW